MKTHDRCSDQFLAKSLSKWHQQMQTNIVQFENSTWNKSIFLHFVRLFYKLPSILKWYVRALEGTCVGTCEHSGVQTNVRCFRILNGLQGHHLFTDRNLRHHLLWLCLNCSWKTCQKQVLTSENSTKKSCVQDLFEFRCRKPDFSGLSSRHC